MRDIRLLNSVLEKRSGAVVEIVEQQVVIVGRFQSPVTDLLHVGRYLSQHGACELWDLGEIVHEELQDKTLPTSEDEATQLIPVNFPQEQQPREERAGDSQQAEDDSDKRNGQENHPPEPEGKEVLLIEDVVPQNTEQVLVKHNEETSVQIPCRDRDSPDS